MLHHETYELNDNTSQAMHKTKRKHDYLRRCMAFKDLADK